MERKPIAISPIDEMLDFLLSRPTLEQMILLRASDAAQERIRYLLDGNTISENHLRIFHS